MATEPEQIEIEIEENAKKQDEEIKVVEAEKEAEPEVEKAEIKPDDGIESLKKRLEQETSARLEAERRAREAQVAAYNAKNEVQDTNITLINQAMDNLKQSNEVLKSNLAVAMQSGDYERAAEIQTSLSENSAKLLQLDQGKTALETQKKQPQPVPQHSDPVEALASQLTPRSAEWVRRNPDFARDPVKYQKMIAAHNIAVADGFRADTDDYFNEIEGILKIRRAEPEKTQEDPTSQAAKPTQTRSSPPVAPVSRSGTPTGTRPNVVRLTAAEREIAQMMGMTDSEYAKNKLALQREGKLS